MNSEVKVKIYGPCLFKKEMQNIEEYLLKTPHRNIIACIEIYTKMGIEDGRDIKKKIEEPYGCTLLYPEEIKKILDHVQKIPHQNIISNIKIQLV